MGSITLTLPTAGAKILAGLHSTNYAALQALLNGNVDSFNLADDAVGIAELSASGTPSASTYLRGDNSWAAVPAPVTYRKNTTKVVASTTSATDLLNGEITIAANALPATGVLRLTAWGTFLNNSGSSQNSPRLDLRLGSTLLLDTNVITGTTWSSNAAALPWKVVVEINAANATNSQIAQMILDYVLVSSGAAAATFGTGVGIHRNDAALGGYSQGKAQGTNSSSKDMTSAQLLELRATLPVANANCQATLLGALVEII